MTRNKLQNIIFKYTQIDISPASHIFDNTWDIIESSILILDGPKNIRVEDYILSISNHLMDGAIVATLFINGSEKFFQDKSNFGTVLVVEEKIVHKIVEEYYDKTPSQILAVTGTFGKTSTTVFLYELLLAMGVKASMVGTLGLRGIPINFLKTTRNTTPSWIALKRILHISKENNIDTTIIEVSTHGIGKKNDDSRLKNIKFTGGIWTGFGTDHLEYHGTLENYFATKHDFMASLPLIVVNKNVYNFFSINFTPRYIYSKEMNHITHEGFQFNGIFYKKSFSVKFFQQENLLGAMLLLYGLGYENVFNFVDLDVQIPARMEYFGKSYGGADIYSDNAYRPESIQNVLSYFTPLNLKRLILIAGAGGDRSRGINYRKDIGFLSSKVYKLIITDDNPRKEDAFQIRNEIIGIDSTILNIPNRFDALITAFTMSKLHHIILIIGHGSDETVLYKNYYVLMNDKEIFQHYKFHYSPLIGV